MERITAATIVTPQGLRGPGAVIVDDGIIVDVESARPSDTIPARLLVPGFVDVQVNGIGPVDVATARDDDWDELDRRLLAQGVTTWCPTLVSAPLDRYAEPLVRIAAAAARADGDEVRPAIAGAHLEGPFLGGAPGAHPRDVLVPPDLEWLRGLPDIVCLVTLAPEVAHALDAISLLVDRDVLVSLGHSTASFDETRAAIDAGARLVTHCFNGMGPLHHRDPGLVGAALTDDRVAVSVIADLVHLHPAAVSLIFRAKPAERVALVTDAVAWDERDTSDAPRLPDGTLMGSTVTADRALRNVVQQCGVSLEAAVEAASTTPAALLGLDDRGRIEPGARADFVLLGPDLTVMSTWVAGRTRG